MHSQTARFEGRTALITGSTGGLGVAIAHRLAAEGALVIVSGRSRTRGDAVVAGIRSDGGQAEFVTTDLSAGEQAIRLAVTAATDAAGGHLDILVNNAATILTPRPTADITEPELHDNFAVNVFAPFVLTGILAPEMARHGNGAIINIGSITGLRGANGSAVYCATKAAMHSLTTSWADEYGPLGVRVNAVAPGSFPDPDQMSADAFKARHASNIHGAILSVDGGWAAI